LVAKVDAVADAPADEAGTAVVMVLLPAGDPWPANFSWQ